MLVLKEGKNYGIGTTCGLSKIPQEFLSLPFNKIISEILSPKAVVSIVFVRESKMKELNKKYRKINKSTDVLSFESEDGGEILFSINDVRRKALSFKLSALSYLSYLLIHGLLHLKGMTHGSRMDKKEMEFCKKFQIIFPSTQNSQKKNEKTDHSRNRHRDLRSKSYSSVNRRR